MGDVVDDPRSLAGVPVACIVLGPKGRKRDRKIA